MIGNEWTTISVSRLGGVARLALSGTRGMNRFLVENERSSTGTANEEYNTFVNIFLMFKYHIITLVLIGVTS